MDESSYGRAAEALRSGCVIALPTDTVYGVAASIGHPDAVGRLFEVKGRAHTDAIAVLVADVEQARHLGIIGERERALADRWWPGALTLVVDRREGTDVDLGGDSATIGLRCPADASLRRLCLDVGPLAATSANLTGEPTPSTSAGVAGALGASVDLVIDDGRRSALASTVVSLVGGGWQVLRVGEVDPEELRAAVHGLT